MGTNWTSVLIGWIATPVASLILGWLVAVVVGVITSALGFEAGTSELGGVLNALSRLSYRGYAAGGMSGHEGTKHGLLVGLLALAITPILTP